jgi:hypothetical protein
LTLREEHRLRVFENRVLKRIFGPNRDKMTGGWRKLHNEELHNLIKSRKMRWTGNVHEWGEEECIQDSGGKARRKETTGKTKT